jgi:hypothetical protein
VEIGAYHGITTCFFAEHSSTKVYAVDPYIGFGGSNHDYRIFLRNTEEKEDIVKPPESGPGFKLEYSYNSL